jgi:hypothetical protein
MVPPRPPATPSSWSLFSGSEQRSPRGVSRGASRQASAQILGYVPNFGQAPFPLPLPPLVSRCLLWPVTCSGFEEDDPGWIGSASLQAELSPWNQIGSRRKLSNIESIMAGMGHSEVGLCWWPLRASIFHLRAPTQPEGKVPFSMSFLCLSLFLLYLSAYCVLGCLHWSEMNDSQSFKYLVSVGIDDGAILFGLLTRRLSIYRSELFNGLFHGAVLYHWP